MKIKQLVELLNLSMICECNDLERDVKGVYCCDLLSWVMSHAEKGNIWITVQVHPNIVAVASLLELSCIIIPEDIEVEEITLKKSVQENIPVLRSSLTAHELCFKLGELGV